MIKRIVKMSFPEENIPTFKANFEANKEHIRGYPGCHHVELLQGTDEPTTFFTFSIWESNEALNEYRHSDLFKGIWAKTKPLFQAPPEAWSLDLIGVGKY